MNRGRTQAENQVNALCRYTDLPLLALGGLIDAILEA